MNQEKHEQNYSIFETVLETLSETFNCLHFFDKMYIMTYSRLHVFSFSPKEFDSNIILT